MVEWYYIVHHSDIYSGFPFDTYKYVNIVNGEYVMLSYTDTYAF